MRVAAPALALALLPGLGLAQIGNPGFMSPDTRFDAQGIPEPNQPNDTDKLFAQLVAEGGKAEVALAGLAADRADATEVGDFARRMTEDHTGANDQLASLAAASSIPLPDGLNAEHQAMQAQLESLEGRAFDLAYMQGQVVDHQKTAQLMIWEIAYGQDVGLQQFAIATLPRILEHLRLARGIVDDLSHDRIAETAPPAEAE